MQVSCLPLPVLKGEAAERNFRGELNLAKRVAQNQALGRRGKLLQADGQQREDRNHLQTKVKEFDLLVW